MASNTELDRIAAQANALRPDWPVRSVLTYLQREHSHRAYRDLAVAMAYIATDPATHYPRRLSEMGPWWSATAEASNTPLPGPGQAPRCPVHGHDAYRADTCTACRADFLETGRWPVASQHRDATHTTGTEQQS